MTSVPAPPPDGIRLTQDDLIADREVADVAEDRLAHDGIVEQLAALVGTVKTPSNIALYGPWGSGKSGVANLLKAKIDKKQGVRFVRFDAFKYADVPLRRNFISAVASELEQRKDKYHDDLYSGRTKTEITVPPATFGKLMFIFGGLLLVLSLVIAAVVAIYIAGQNLIGRGIDDFSAEFRSLSSRVLVAGLLPAALLSALVALASKTFNVDRSVQRPDSDEQFEALFRDLVRDCGAHRLVVFIDELDRCSADEVVATLDTIRTFLGIQGCVFVVAADQNVLEGALTRAAKQETPSDDTNPYYSTGSAYLDKVFQYQLSLPPLLIQSVGHYAKSLVEGRSGVWAEVGSDYVLSVLIPTHVTSPRRVKHLLNTFALTYRLAAERHRIGLLAESPSANAASIARLVCLRVEFPLFARHLEVDWNLPSLVSQLVRDPNAQPSGSPSTQALELARSYALGKALPGTLLTGDAPAELPPGGGNTAADGEQRTARQHNQQLLNYLSRTTRVPGPSRDLVYMQSTGTQYGLDGAVARAIEDAAANANDRDLTRLISDLDQSDQSSALQVLGNLMRTGGGLTGPNAARALLLMTSRLPGLAISPVVDTIAEDIARLDDETDVLDEEIYESAWNLAKLGSEAGSIALRERVVTVAVSDPDTTTDFLVDDALLATQAAPKAMPQYLAARVLSRTGRDVVARLYSLPDEQLVTVLNTLRSPLGEAATGAFAVHTAWAEQTKSPTGTAVSAAAAAAVAESEPFDPKAVIGALQEHAANRETPVQHATLHLLIRIDHIEGRHAVAGLLTQTEPTEDSTLIFMLLRATSKRARTQWPIWLDNIRPEAIAVMHALPIQNLVKDAWDGDKDTAATREAALGSLQPLIECLPAARRPDLQETVAELVAPFVETNAEAAERTALLSKAKSFAEIGVLNYDLLLSDIVATLEDTLAATAPVATEGDALYDYVLTVGTEATRNLDVAPDRVGGIVSEAASSPWLDACDRVRVPLEFAKAAQTRNVAVATERLPNADAVTGAVANYGERAARGAALWLELMTPTPTEFSELLDAASRENALSDEVQTAAATAVQNWDPADHHALLTARLASPDADPPSNGMLKSLGLALADETFVADLLASRFKAATNNSQRQHVIGLWKAASIEGGAPRRKLLETVVYGLLELHTTTGSNAGAVELALAALDSLGQPLPYGVKQQLGYRVRDAVEGLPSVEDKALRVMDRIGYRRSGGFFRKKGFDPSS